MRTWLSLAYAVFRRAWRHDCTGLAKAAAYSTLLFCFPLLVFIIALLVATGWFTVVLSPVLAFLPTILPGKAHDLVFNYIDSTAKSDPTHLLVASFILMLWTGWGLMGTYIEGVNRAYGLAEHRTLLKDQLAAVQLLAFVAMPLVAFGATALFCTRLEEMIQARYGIAMHIVWKLVRWLTLLVALMAVNSIIYYVGVHRKQNWRCVLPGALLATVIWFASSLIFETYVFNFGRYDLIYGGLGAAIILLAFMYLSSLAVFLGGEFNALLDERRDLARRPPP